MRTPIRVPTIQGEGQAGAFVGVCVVTEIVRIVESPSRLTWAAWVSTGVFYDIYTQTYRKWKVFHKDKYPDRLSVYIAVKKVVDEYNQQRSKQDEARV